MKKYINLIISSVSLLVTTTLLILSMFAWYVVNETAKASGIIAASDSIRGSFDFYYWNDTSTTNEQGVTTESGSWVKSNNDLRIKDAWPDDVFYFKIVGSSLDAGQKLTVSFSGIDTNLNTDYVTGAKNGSNYEVSYSGVVQYTSTTTSIDVDYNGTDKTLYNLTQNEDDNTKYDVNLDEILIQDVFKVYTAPTVKTVGTTTDFPASKGTTKVDIDGTIYNETITAADNGTKTIYFALSFDSLGDAIDNFYQFQGLVIKNVQISVG
ncbi:MAG: hypothetical protein K6E20_02700 [Acholeplasmatales bacterium]|nr:hypothetical protein [Acholeplasmatales bacterium]